MLNIVLFGPPGAGKGTQSEKLISAYQLVHLSTGDILRAEIAGGTELGMEAKKLMDQGILVPDEVVIGMIRSKLDQNKDAKGFIFDGFPRTTAQAEALDNLLKENNTGISMMLALEVSNEELTKRLLLRGEKSGRPDDRDEEVIRRRIDEYNSKTAPLKEYYMAQNKYRAVHGIGTIDEIFEGLCSAINFSQSEKTPKAEPVPEKEGVVAKMVEMVKNVFSKKEKAPVKKAAPGRVKTASKPAAKKEVKPAAKAQVKPAAKKVIAAKKAKTASAAVKPAVKKAAPVKKAAAKKISATKTAAKKTAVKKVTAKKVAAKKVAKKVVKKVAAKKTAKKIIKKVAAKKTVAKRPVAKKVAKKVVKKIAPKKVAAKKATAKKTAPKKAVKKVAKKIAAKKTVKKAVKKIAPKKTVKKASKKTAPKKAVKKAVKKIVKKVASKKAAKKGRR
jgi:adenylate kinase